MGGSYAAILNLVFMFGALVFVVGTQEMPLNCPALIEHGVLCPGSQGTVATGEIVLSRLPFPGHLHRKQTEAHSPVFL